MNKKKIFIILLSTLIFISLFKIQSRAEYVFLKDGKIIKCSILQDSSKFIKIRQTDKKIQKIDRNLILRILYTEIYMGKVHIRKADGNVIEGYMVAENNKTYTFRKNLYSPNEFTLNRNEVLFIIRTNPTLLTGNAEKDRVKLSWKPPYNKVKYYIIYLKEENKKFIKNDKTGQTSITIKNLKPSTKYTFKVTAVDRKNVESLPTNLITLTTGLSEPPPEKIKLKKISSKKDKNMDIRLTWEKVGKNSKNIKGYRVYSKYCHETEDKYSVIAETQENMTIIKDLDKRKNYCFVVRTIDRKNNESTNSKVARTRIPVEISARVDFVLPVRTFGENIDFGWGSLLNISLKDCFVPNLDFGIDGSFFTSKGKITNLKNYYLITVDLKVSYNFQITNLFAISPNMGVGIGYSIFDYNSYGPDSEESFGGKNQENIDPHMKLGVLFKFRIYKNFFMYASTEYSMMFEKSTVLDYVSISIGAGANF